MTEASNDDTENTEIEKEDEVITICLEPLQQKFASFLEVSQGMTLIQSCQDGNMETLKSGIDTGYPAAFITTTGWTPVSAAAYSGHLEIVAYLHQIEADAMYGPFKIHENDSRNASEHNNLSKTDEPSVLDAFTRREGKDLLLYEQFGKHLTSPLHWACYKGHSEIVTLLVQSGYDPEAADTSGNRCLHMACMSGNFDVLKLLLTFSVNINAKNCYGNRPIDVATNESCRNLLTKLITQKRCAACQESLHTSRSCLCQQCLSYFCSNKSCTLQIDVPATESNEISYYAIRSMRYCQNCIVILRETGYELQAALNRIVHLVQHAISLLISKNPSDPAAESESKEAKDSKEPSATQATEVSETHFDQRQELCNSFSKMKQEEINAALSLRLVDMEILHTCIQAAPAQQAIDSSLVFRARTTYDQVIAHIDLQDRIKELIHIRPIRALMNLDPLQNAYYHAKKANVDETMLCFADHVIRSTHAECILYGCHVVCSKINRGHASVQGTIKRLEASVKACDDLRVSPKLLESSVALCNRLKAEINLQHALAAFTNTAQGHYKFTDGLELETLLQALETRAQRITTALVQASEIEKVSIQLLEEGNNLLKQLRKDIRDEAKLEEDRRREKEELLAAKKKKKSAKKKS